MEKKVLKIALIIGVMITVLTGTVFAATGTVTGSTVRIRESADSDSNAISAAQKGEKVEIVGEEGNWYHVRFENITGYISKDYVSTDEEVPEEVENTPTSTPEPESEPTPAPEPEPEPLAPEENQTVTFEHDVTLRYLPNFSSRVHFTVSSGSTYTIRASLNNWIKVSNEVNSGWLLKKEIDGTSTSPVESNNTTEPENHDDFQEKGTVNVDSARIRKTPDGEVIGSIPMGTEVAILGEEDGWYQIRVEGYEDCYIAKRLIKEM